MSPSDESKRNEEDEEVGGNEDLEALRRLIRQVRGEYGYWERYKQAPKPRYGDVSELGQSSKETAEEPSEE